MNNFLAVLAVLLTIGGFSPRVVAAGDPVNGKTIYIQWGCDGCHGDPKNNKDGILTNGKTPSGIRFGWSVDPDSMPFAGSILDNDPGMMDDLAAYIASRGTTSSGPTFSASPTTKNFGSLPVGSTSAATTFTITDAGAAGSLTAISSSNSAEFPLQGGTCLSPSPKPLAINATCTVLVAFAPSVAGSRSASISIVTNGAPSTLSISVSGTGSSGTPAAGHLDIAPSKSFGSQPVGVQTSASALTVTNSGGTTVAISSVTTTNTTEFPLVANGCSGSIAPGASCTLVVAFKPSTTGIRAGTLTIISNGTGSPQAIALSGTGTSASATIVPAEGIWWASPATSESGWGINVSQQDGSLFLTWFTFAADRSAWWIVAQATKTTGNTYTGLAFSGTGPAFSSVPFNPALVVGAGVGNISITFTDTTHATFSYTINGISQTKAIELQVFGSAIPTCTWSANANLNAATNYQDMWWASPAGSESGWGLNIAHQGDSIFATWFTFAVGGKPMWLVFGAPKVSDKVYAGSVVTGTGPPLGTVPFDPAAVVGSAVGNATLTFTDGNHATFAYTIFGVTQSKSITREIYGSGGGTVCH